MARAQGLAKGKTGLGLDKILSFIEVILVTMQKSLSTLFFTSDPLTNYFFFKLVSTLDPTKISAKKKIPTLVPTLLSTKK